MVREVHPNSMGKGLRREKPSTGSGDGMGSLGIDFLPENSRDMTGNPGTVNTVSRSLVPMGVLEIVLCLDCTGQKWGQCSAFTLNHTTE